MFKEFRIFFFLVIVSGKLMGQTDFVIMDGKEFKLNGKRFYPISMNYLVDIVVDDHDSIFIAPHHAYTEKYGYTCKNKLDCFNEILRDLNQIRHIGFNSIRLIGLSFGYIKYGNLNRTTYPAYLANQWFFINSKVIPIKNGNLFKHISQVLIAADSADLKVQLLVGQDKIDSLPYRQEYISYLGEIADHFKDNTTLYSYDFMNEPLYSDLENNSKSQICELVNNWNSAIKQNSKYHLTTIGLAHSEDVFEWDPAVMNLDFLSFHVYSTNLDIFKSEIKWISENSILPWIIGETGFKANDSDTTVNSNVDGTEAEQKKYVKETLESVRNCGGQGYSWWQFKDLAYNGIPYYYGMVNRNTLKPKPAAQEFQNFNPNITNGICGFPSNYYNLTGQKRRSYSGAVLNQNGEPIKNAVIITQDKNRLDFTKTFSHEDGRFFVYAKNDAVFVKISAYGASIYEGKAAPTFQYIKLNENIGFRQNCSFNTVSVGQNFTSSNTSILIYPNPTSKFITIESIYGQAMSNIKIYDNLSQIVYSQEASSMLFYINLSELKDGIYSVKIEVNNEFIFKRLILY